MAKIGNEANLILKLAKERMKNKAPARLKEEVDFRVLPGNYPEEHEPEFFLTCGFNLCWHLYETILSDVTRELENR